MYKKERRNKSCFKDKSLSSVKDKILNTHILREAESVNIKHWHKLTNVKLTMKAKDSLKQNLIFVWELLMINK